MAVPMVITQNERQQSAENMARLTSLRFSRSGWSWSCGNWLRAFSSAWETKLVKNIEGINAKRTQMPAVPA